MSSVSPKGSLKSRILKTSNVYWDALIVLQPESFKELTFEDRTKLKESMITGDFSQPFYVWQDEKDDIIYCLDGKHRIEVLKELNTEGYDIPKLLPATFIDCLNKKDAASLVLKYSSSYAVATQKGLYDFIELFELQLPELKDTISLPGIDLDEFERMNFSPAESDIIGDLKDKPATMKITFSGPEQLERAKKEIDIILEKYEGAFMSVSCGEI